MQHKRLIPIRLMGLVFPFFGKFPQLSKKKLRLVNPTKGFLRFLKNLPYLDPKKLEVVRFKQCVPIGHQN
jgi:hypothetical protein